MCRSSWKDPTGDSEALAIITYDDAEKIYTVYLVASNGATSLWRGTLEGESFKYGFGFDADGQAAKVRLTETVKSEVLIWTQELSVAGGPWTVIGEGRERKVH
jgi:hypothetical protein